jgi:hypothetical protein
VLSLTACGRIGFDAFDFEENGGDTDTDTDTDTDADTDAGTEAYCDTHLCWDVLPTGQDKCYDDSVEFPCSNITMPCNSDGSPAFCGQDALYPPNAKNLVPSAGVDGTIVTDSQAGLIWKQEHLNMLTWSEAQQYCEVDLNAASWSGYSDWRLPTIHELAGIVNFSQQDPAIDATGFPSSPLVHIWTSSTDPDDLNQAFIVYGLSGWFWLRNKTETGSVFCVRGAERYESSPERFVVEDVGGEEIVHDQATGLIWQRAIEQRNWQGSLEHCESLTYGGKSDWRLPDMNELVSLFNFDLGAADGRSDFPAPGGAFTASLWTATPAASESYAWFVTFESGATNKAGNISSFLLVICVRTGPTT